MEEMELRRDDAAEDLRRAVERQKRAAMRAGGAWTGPPSSDMIRSDSSRMALSGS